MILFADTSAFIKLFIDEPGSNLVAAHVSRSRFVVVTQIGQVEGHAALARAYKHYKRLTSQQFSAASQALQEWFSCITVIPVDEHIIKRAIQCTTSYGLRAYDALQLASALAVQDLDPVFITADKELQEAASQSGLKTIDVNAE